MLKRISILLITVLMGFAAAACTQQEQRTAGYGVGGAALGAVTGGALTGSRRGALNGAAIGAVAGTLLGAAQTRNGVQYCNYRDSYGRVYQAPCN